jgi:(S)-ureidoglycine aminohydrolase
MTTTRTALAGLACCAALSAPAPAVEGNLASGVHGLGSGHDAPALAGTTLDLERLEVRSVDLEPGGSARIEPDQLERMIIVGRGSAELSLADRTASMPRGSLALVLPGDAVSVGNRGGQPVRLYLVAYRSRAEPDLQRGRRGGGSLLVPWGDLEFRPHDKGGLRQYFDRPTAMFERLEIHVTTLNGGLTNHEAHTHRVEELVLLLEGEVEMLLGEEWRRVSAGDLVFVASDVPHSLRNLEETPSVYFAIQGL